MVDVTEILQHWYAGRPKVEVARSLGVDAKTVRRYVAPAEAAGMTPGGPAVSEERWRGRGAVGLPAETELIRGAFLLEEELEHAGRRPSSCQRGGLLVRACLPQPVQQIARAVRVVEGGEAVPGFGPGPRCAEQAACSASMKSMAMPGVRPGPRCANAAIGVAIRATTGRGRGSAPGHRPGGRVGVS
jgi:hypothetical protein